MIEPFLYNLKKQGKNKGKTRNFVLKTRVFDEKDGVFEKGRSFENPGFWKKDGVFERTGF